MDLNAPPIPEGNEAMYSEVFSEDSTRIEPRMTAAETNQPVADGRRPKPKRKYPYDNSMQGSHSFRKKNEGYDRYSLSSGSESRVGHGGPPFSDGGLFLCNKDLISEADHSGFIPDGGLH
ncbi:hypothetical protein ACET3Z_005457 [Daucus carota]